MVGLHPKICSLTRLFLRWKVVLLAVLLLGMPGVCYAQASVSVEGVARASTADRSGDASSLGNEPPRRESSGKESQQEAVQQKVELFHAALMRSARTKGGFAERAVVVSPALTSVFDIERIARISAGRAWRNLSETTKAEYVALLRDVVIATYVSRFDADRGQSFETLGTDAVKPQRFVVKTRIKRLGAKAVPLDYYFRDGRIFNVVADGVSDLSVRRADYAAIVTADGFDGLLLHLRAQLTAARERAGADNTGNATDDGA